MRDFRVLFGRGGSTKGCYLDPVPNSTLKSMWKCQIAPLSPWVTVTSCPCSNSPMDLRVLFGTGSK